MPTVADRKQSCPPTRNGSLSASMMFCPTGNASRCSRKSVTSTVNSSPPWRETVSLSRTVARILLAASHSRTSPAPCPWESFTDLK